MTPVILPPGLKVCSLAYQVLVRVENIVGDNPIRKVISYAIGLFKKMYCVIA
jgi:hypothetical protein